MNIDEDMITTADDIVTLGSKYGTYITSINEAVVVVAFSSLARISV